MYVALIDTDGDGHIDEDCNNEELRKYRQRNQQSGQSYYWVLVRYKESGCYPLDLKIFKYYF